MAANATSVFEIRTTGSSTNAGGYDASIGTNDYSQQANAQYSLTSLTSSGAGSVVLCATASADMVGNFIQITGGTSFTTGFFEITAVSVGVSFTCATNQAGTAVTVGVGANGVGNIGGAYKFAGAAPDATFASNIPAGATVWIKAGSHTTANSLSWTDGTNAHPTFITGYNATRGDAPSGGNRPSLNISGGQYDVGSLCTISNLIITGNASAMMTSDGEAVYNNLKVTNTSTTTGHICIQPGSGDLIINCEIVSQAGIGITSSSDLTVVGCYIHDCVTGVKAQTTGSPVNILNNIIAGCATFGIQVSAAETGIAFIAGNTIYGGEALAIGTGLSVATSASGVRVLNNIFYGLTVGVTATASTAQWSNWNDFFNNTTNRTNWTAGASDISTNPSFTQVSQLSGTAGTASSAVLTDSANTFSGKVTANQDYLMVISGTGVTDTPGSLLITGVGTNNVTCAANIGGTGTNLKYSVRSGHNFAPTATLAGFPGSFPGALTQGSISIGAAQAAAAASTGTAKEHIGPGRIG